MENRWAATGAVTGAYTYDAFGAFGAVRSHTGAGTEWSFTGEQNDPTGLEYLRARYYDPATGRFLSRDPLPGGHPYVYAVNNPALLIDPLGLCGAEGRPPCLAQPPTLTPRAPYQPRSGGLVCEYQTPTPAPMPVPTPYCGPVRVTPVPGGPTEIACPSGGSGGGSLLGPLGDLWDWLTSRSPECYERTALFVGYCGTVAAGAGSGVGAVYAVGNSTLCGTLFVSMVIACGD